MPRPFQATRFGRAIARALGLQGQFPLTILEDVSPTVELLSHRDPEFAYLVGERRWSRGGTAAAVAGQFSFVQLLNPAGSGLLVVVERYKGAPAAGVNRVGIAFNQLGVGGGGILAPRDTRITSENARAVATIETGSNAVQFLALDLVIDSLTAAQVDGIPCDVVLSPGHALAFECTTVNTAVNALFWWREFNPAPQEFAGRG